MAMRLAFRRRKEMRAGMKSARKRDWIHARTQYIAVSAAASLAINPWDFQRSCFAAAIDSSPIDRFVPFTR